METEKRRNFEEILREEGTACIAAKDSKALDEEVASYSDNRTISDSEFVRLVECAEGLHQAEAIKQNARALVEESMAAMPKSPEGITLSTAYKVAKDIGVPEEYIRRAIELNHPSLEKQLADIDDAGLWPTQYVTERMRIDHNIKIARFYAETICKKLNESFLNKEFVVKGPEVYHCAKLDITQNEKPANYSKNGLQKIKHLLFRIKMHKKQNESVIGFRYGESHMIVYFNDPSVVSACHEEIKSLTKKYKNKLALEGSPELMYTYVPGDKQ